MLNALNSTCLRLVFQICYLLVGLLKLVLQL